MLTERQRNQLKDEIDKLGLRVAALDEAIHTGNVADVVTGCDELIGVARELGVAAFRMGLPEIPTKYIQ